MTTSTTDETGTAPATATGDQPKAAKKAGVAPRGAHVAKKKGKSTKMARPAKKAGKRAKSAKSGKAPSTVRHGSKTENVLELLKRPGGVTLKELMKTTGWQAHSIRGFLSGTIGKKLGLAVKSTKGKDGERSYSIKA